MNAIEARNFLRVFCVSVIALPVLFIGFYSLGGMLSARHITLRLAIIVGFSLIAIVLAKRHLGGYALSVFPRRILTAIGLLLAIASYHMFFGGIEVMLTVERTVMWLVYLLLGATLFLIFQKVEPNEVLLITFVALVGASLLYMTLVSAWFVYAGSPSGSTCTNIMPGFKNVRYTAYFTAPALGLALAVVAMHSASTYLRIVAFCAATLLWIYLEYTGARGAALAIAAACLTTCLVVPLNVAGRVVIAAVVTAAVAFGVSLMITPADCASFGMFNRLQGTVQSEDPGTGRIEIWLTTWDLIKARPWFGYGEIRLFNVIDTPVTQPHNALLQVPLAWGFVGATVFFALVGEFLVRLGVAARQGPWQAWPVLFGLVTILLYGQISGALYHAFPLLFTTILAAAAAGLLFRPSTRQGA